MYEAIRQAAPRITSAYDLVFIVYSDQLALLPADAIQRAVVEKLEKAGVFDLHEGSKAATHDIVEPKENEK
jgi:hypothetical protein